MEDNSLKTEIDSDIANLSEKITYQINNNIKEENTVLLEENKNNKKLDEINKKSISKNKFNFLFEKKGYTYIFLVDKNNNPIITIGPHWIMFLLLILFVTGGFLFLFIYYWKFLNIYLRTTGIMIYLIFCYVYTYIFLSDPGIPKKIDEDIVNKDKNKYLYCNFCKNWVTIESKTRHCRDCNICIEGQDHHCSWTSKCIAKKNLYYFYFLIFWICVFILYYTFAFIIAHDNWFKYKKLQIKLKKMGRNK